MTSGTQEKYTVDIWSGNHPFFKGASNTVVVDEGSVNRFKRRYAGLDSLSDTNRIKTGELRCFQQPPVRQTGECVVTCTPPVPAGLFVSPECVQPAPLVQ